MGLISKKGIFFTIDALVGAILILGGVLIASSFYIAEQPRETLTFFADDVKGILSEIRISELNNSYVSSLISAGIINDTNKTVLEQIGIFWSKEDLFLAQNFTKNITENLVPENYGYGIWIDGDLIYEREGPPKKSVSSSKKLVSGVEKSKPIEGYVASARALNVQKQTSEIISFSPGGAGWDGTTSQPGEAIITKYFNLSNVTITNATFYISVHIEVGGPDWTVVNINSGKCTINRNSLNRSEGEGVFDVKNVTGCFNPGPNNITLSLKNPGYNAHIHPGSYLLIKYNTTETPSEIYTSFSKRYYFDNIRSIERYDDESGAWTTVPFYIPIGAVNASVAIKVHGKSVYNYGGSLCCEGFIWCTTRCRDIDYHSYLNSENYFDKNASPSAEPVYTYGHSYTSPFLQEGTNVFSVYFNNYADTDWGEDDTIIYSDPFNDPSGSSYIEVNYTLQEQQPFGLIEIRQVKEFGGPLSRDKTTSFSFPEEAASISSVFTNVVQQYSYKIQAWAGTTSPPATMFFESASSRAVPTTIYVDGSYLDVSETATNYIRIRDVNNNEIRPQSSVDYGFYVKSSVGYGDVFSTLDAAVNDAKQRLNQSLGQFVSSSNLIVTNESLTDVPSLWGPAVLDVRVWS